MGQDLLGQLGACSSERTQAPSWSRAGMRWDTKELFDSPELTRLLKAPIMAIFKALGVRNSDRPVAEPRPRPQCARFFALDGSDDEQVLHGRCEAGGVGRQS